MRKILLLCALWFVPVWALKIDRVILSTDNHPNYIQFWPLVARVWKEKMGIQPTLALIGDESVQVDTTLGDVIRFKPIPSVPTWFYAQTVRLLMPAYFPNDVCVISDIDMLPLNRDYFVNGVAGVTNPDAFVVFRDKAMPNRFPMCYLAARGTIFQELFELASVADIPATVKEWFSFGMGWETDELLLHRVVTRWDKYLTHVVKLGYGAQVQDRICRTSWHYNAAELKKGSYVDAHLPRPYDKHKEKIDKLVKDLGLLN